MKKKKIFLGIGILLILVGVGIVLFVNKQNPTTRIEGNIDTKEEVLTYLKTLYHAENYKYEYIETKDGNIIFESGEENVTRRFVFNIKKQSLKNEVVMKQKITSQNVAKGQ